MANCDDLVICEYCEHCDCVSEKVTLTKHQTSNITLLSPEFMEDVANLKEKT